jgi:hypothetical protein
MYDLQRIFLCIRRADAVGAQRWVKDKAAATRDYVETQGAEVRNRIKEVAEVIGRG